MIQAIYIIIIIISLITTHFARLMHVHVRSMGVTSPTSTHLVTHVALHSIQMNAFHGRFTTKKKAERILKTAKAMKKLDLSAIPPDEYASRFLTFVQRLTF